MEGLLNNLDLTNNMQEFAVSESTYEPESLLNHEEIKGANDESDTGLTVYDQPEITKPSKHPEYEGGIPPYEVQAQIVFDNYVRNTNRIMFGKEKRRLYRECLRNAKKGRYRYMFDPEKIQKRQERARLNFEKLNNSQ